MKNRRGKGLAGWVASPGKPFDRRRRRFRCKARDSVMLSEVGWRHTHGRFLMSFTMPKPMGFVRHSWAVCLISNGSAFTNAAKNRGGRKIFADSATLGSNFAACLQQRWNRRFLSRAESNNRNIRCLQHNVRRPARRYLYCRAASPRAPGERRHVLRTAEIVLNPSGTDNTTSQSPAMGRWLAFGPGSSRWIPNCPLLETSREKSKCPSGLR